MRSARIPVIPLFTLSSVALLVVGGCSKPPGGTSQPAVSTLIAPESRNWTQEQAVAQLDDATLGISAAVRLVQLRDAQPACLPGEPSDEVVERLRLVKVDEECWALGVAERERANHLRAPVLINAEGQVRALGVGLEEELLVLRVSKDARVLPHLLVSPARVRTITPDVQPAFALAEGEAPVWFEVREQRGYGYVALRASEQPEEIARYTWDPDEEMFLGPAANRLPDPPGGRFELDLEASELLVPLGGELPEPKEMEPPEERQWDPRQSA